MDVCGNSNTKEFPVDHLETCIALPNMGNLNNVTALQNREVRIFPNPSTKQFTIAFSQKKKTDYSIQIFNAAGMQVYSTMLRNIDAKNLTIAENLKAGVYMINIVDLKTNKRTFHKQVVL